MILVFRETDGKTGDRLTIGEGAVPDGSTLMRSGRKIIGTPGGAPHAAVTVVDGDAIDLQIGGGSGQVLTADLLYDPNFFSIDGTNHLTAAGTLVTHDLLSVTHHGDTIPAAVVRGDIITGQGAAPNTFWQRLQLGGSGTYLRSDGTDASWSALVAGDLPNLGTQNKLTKFGATGLADSILTEAVGGIEIPTAKYFGLGAAKGRMTFEDAATDYICFVGCNVGIGTTAPVYELHLHDPNSDNASIHFTAQSTGMLITDGLTIGIDNTPRATIWYRENNPIDFGTNGTQRMRIAANGNVGIGTTAPVYELHLHDPNSDNACIHFTAQSTGMLITDGLTIGIDNTPRATIWYRENNPIDFGTNGTQRMRIAANGNVGIGTTAPAALVDLKNGSLYFTDSDCAHGVTTYLPNDVYGSIHAASATDGGLDILGISDTDNYGLSLQGMVGDDTPSLAPMRLVAMKKNGTGAADMGYDELAYSFTNRGRQVVSIYGDGNLNLYNEAVDATGDVLTFWKERHGFADIDIGDVIGEILFNCYLSSSYTSSSKIQGYFVGANGTTGHWLNFYCSDIGGNLDLRMSITSDYVYVYDTLYAETAIETPLLRTDHIAEDSGSHGIVFDHNMSSTNKNLSSGTADIADDNFTSFTPGRTHGIMLMSCQNTSIGVVVGYEVGATPSITIIAQNGTSFEVTTGALAGTTGSDAKFTLSTHTDGKIYLENRLGGT